MEIINGDLVMTEDMTFDENLKVIGNIYGKDGARYNLKVSLNIDCENINCWDIDCNDLTFYAFAIAYYSFRCKSWKARRKSGFAKCLDSDIVIKKNAGDKCGQELK